MGLGRKLSAAGIIFGLALLNIFQNNLDGEAEGSFPKLRSGLTKGAATAALQLSDFAAICGLCWNLRTEFAVVI